MAPAGHPLWDRLLFRDYLRRHPEAVRRYEKLKYRLAGLYRNDREAYTEGKAGFVKRITDKAKKSPAYFIRTEGRKVAIFGKTKTRIAQKTRLSRKG